MKAKKKNPRALRRRNSGDPPWMWPSIIGFGALVVGAAIYETVHRSNAPVYYYWATGVPGPYAPTDASWIPRIQKAGESTVFELPSTLTEHQALRSAREEIEDRGGRAQLGQPA